MKNNSYPVVIVGAGLSGAVLAERLANEQGQRVVVIDKRNHIAGNCFDYFNEDSIMVARYGAHIFHTDDEEVWQYASQFTDWLPYEHRVLSNVNGMLVPIPINIETINKLLGLNLQTADEMKEWVRSQLPTKQTIQNSEDAALARIGNRELYDLLFKTYTYKQWSLWPNELEPSVLQRIPINFGHDDRYFHDGFQGVPAKGYTAMVQNMLASPLIEVVLDTDFFDIKDSLGPYKKLVYTGPIDQYFNDEFDKLQYRSLKFEFETIDAPSYQETAVVNFPSLDIPYTRIVEHKKLYASDSPRTIISREFPTQEGEPYYPVPTKENREKYAKYKLRAEQTTDTIFAGRLANYKYFNMDQAIRNSLDTFTNEFKNN